MKKSIIIIFLALILSFQLISAVEFNMNENFNSGETLIAKFSGNFIQPITKENVFFYKGNILDSNFRIPLEYDVLKIREDFYIYAILLDKSEGNYSVSIENVKYMKGAQISEEKIVKNFSINSQTADFYVKPGVIATSEGFFIQVQNLQENNIVIDVNTELNNSKAREIFIDENSKTASVSLKSGEIKKINFNLGEGESGLRTIELKTENLIYKIPVYIPSGLKGEASQGALSLNFQPSELNFSLPINSITNKTVYLYNSGDKDLKNISLSVSESLFNTTNLSQNFIENLSAHSYVPLELSFFSSEEKNTEGELNAHLNDTIISSSIFLQFLSNYTSLNETYSTTETCAELNGTLYNSETAICDTEPINAKDNVCCLGNVQEIKTTNNTGKIIAAILIIIALAGLIFFYFTKYRKTKSRIDFIKTANLKKV